MKFSLFAGCEASIGSSEWQHECEIEFLAGLPLPRRNEAIDGVKDGMRGIKTIRGDAAAVLIRSEIDRYAALKAKS